MNLYIRNMVSSRCKMLVKLELENLGIPYLSVDLGEAQILNDISRDQKEKFNVALRKWELELIYNKREVLIEKIQTSIIELVRCPEKTNIKTSYYLEHNTSYNYTYLSNLFSKERGITIKQYSVLQKIEYAKELLSYNEMNISEISARLGYHSVAHFSNQFKKTTKVTPKNFKKLKSKKRMPLEHVV